MLNEGEDYYLNETGLVVFTTTYHLKRGYCCKNGCKHCPWKLKKGKKQPAEDNNTVTTNIHES